MSVLVKRDVADEILKYLYTENILVLHGARQVGKTHILYYLRDFLSTRGETVIFFDLEDSRLAELLDGGVEALLVYLKQEGFDLERFRSGPKKLFIFIDEIQYLQNPSPLLKLLSDHHPHLQLIISGSSSFDIKSKFSDSLVGRTVNFEIFNLSFRELLRFKNVGINLDEPLDPLHLEKTKKLYEEYVRYGGYPKVVLEDSIERKEKYLQQILDTYVKKDVRDLANVKDIQKFNNLLKVLAAQSAQLLNVAELSRTCLLAKQTIEHYLFILENTYVIRLVRPFSSSAKVEVIKTPKIFFYDTGLLQMLWLRNLQGNILGPMLETSVFAELVKKYGMDNIHYWRTKTEKEVDFVVRRKDLLLPIEVKLNFNNLKKGAMELFREKYGVKEYKVVGLNGQPQEGGFYPWQV